VVFGVGDTMTTKVRTVRIGAGGVLDPSPVEVVAHLLYKLPGDLTCGPSGCLLAWLDARRYYPSWTFENRISRLGADGRLLDGDDGIPIGGGNPFAVDDGSGFALSFMGQGGARIARITGLGEVEPSLEGLLVVERPALNPNAELRSLWLLGAEPGEAWLAFEWYGAADLLRSARWVW
jgi:hypothetical protein